MSVFIDEHRARFGVEPICRVLGVSASAYYERATGRRSARAIPDERLLEVIEQLQTANFYAYGYRRTWKALLRAGETVGRDRVRRLMKTAGIQGAKRRGKPWRTTYPNVDAQSCPRRTTFQRFAVTKLGTKPHLSSRRTPRKKLSRVETA